MKPGRKEEEKGEGGVRTEFSFYSLSSSSAPPLLSFLSLFFSKFSSTYLLPTLLIAISTPFCLFGFRQWSFELTCITIRKPEGEEYLSSPANSFPSQNGHVNINTIE